MEVLNTQEDLVDDGNYEQDIQLNAQITKSSHV